MTNVHNQEPQSELEADVMIADGIIESAVASYKEWLGQNGGRTATKMLATTFMALQETVSNRVIATVLARLTSDLAHVAEAVSRDRADV